MVQNALEEFYELKSVCHFREDFPALFAAYQRADDYLTSRFPGRNVRDGTNITLDNAMRNWMVMHNNPFMKRTESIEDALKRKRTAADDYFKPLDIDPFDPDYQNDLNQKIFVYYWFKDLREKANDVGNQLEYQPMGGYRAVDR